MPGSPTAPGQRGACDDAPRRVAFRQMDNVGARDDKTIAAQWLACVLPCRRFADILTNACARLGADVVRYTFIVMDFHHLLLAGLPALPFFLSLYDLDPRGLSQFASSLVIYADNAFATGIFTPNAVSYTSPVLWGFQVSALLSLGGVAGDFQNGRQYSASLKYDNGTVMVAASYFNANASTGTALTTPTPTQLPVSFEGRQLGASYKIGKLTAKASFVNFRVGDDSNNVYGGGVDFLALPHLDLNAGVWYEEQRKQTTNHSLLAGIGASYFLSRATTLYAQVAVVNNHGTMDTGLSINNAMFGAGGTTTGVNIGIRHLF